MRRLALNNRGLLNATKDGGWEGGNKGRVVEGGRSKGMERGSNDAREGGSGNIGRVAGTSEE